MAAAVGLELRLRTYPSGDPIRDAGHRRLLERLRIRLHPALKWRTEVPLPIDGDLRAWDAVILGPGWSIGVEAETVLEDLQAVERRLTLKRRDGRVDRTLLLIADTRRNRAALAGSMAAFPGFDRAARQVIRALAVGREPRGDAMLIL